MKCTTPLCTWCHEVRLERRRFWYGAAYVCSVCALIAAWVLR